MAMSNIQKRRLIPIIERIIADNLPAQALPRCHSTLMNRDTRLPPCQLLPVGISRVGNVRSLPEEIRCCPKHSTRFVAVFVAVKRTTSTQTFLYIQLSQQISIYRDIYAHATPCGWVLRKYLLS
jgi:hypothetical protein